MGAHPFRIQNSTNGSAKGQYNDGITNNDVSNGTLTWDVQFDTPGTLLFFQPNMGGMIVVDGSYDFIGQNVGVGTFATGIITVSDFNGTTVDDGISIENVQGTQIVELGPNGADPSGGFPFT